MKRPSSNPRSVPTSYAARRAEGIRDDLGHAVLWPVSAPDALRARLAEMLHLLAQLARAGMSSATPTVTNTDVDSWRQRISQKVGDVQELIESSKFESGDLKVSEIQKATADAQIIFILLLSLARQSRDIAPSNVVQTATVELDSVIATTLEALAIRAAGSSEAPVPALEDTLNVVERSMTGMDALDKEAHFGGRLALYRTLVTSMNGLSSGSLDTQAGPQSLISNGEMFLESRETRIS